MKRIIFYLIVILGVLFSFSSVSAEDLNATQTIPSDDFIQMIPSGDVSLDEKNNNNSFSDLQNQINEAEPESTITLDHDYAYDEGFSSKGISIDKPLTIDGNGHILDGKSKSRIFIIDSFDVILKNITLKGGYATYGGAIHNYDSANCCIISCNFINCEASEEGGAILNDYDSTYLNINSCNFTNCSSHYNGGAICNNGIYSNINSCNFTDCHSGENGGVIENFDDDLEIDNSNFVNCYCSNSGAVINNQCGRCSMESCCFEKCHTNDIKESSKAAVYDADSPAIDMKNCRYD